MGQLILAHRHLVGAVDQDVGTHQQRVAQKPVGGQILVGQLFLLVLVGRDPLQPALRRHHGHEQVQLGVLGHAGLDEDGRLGRIDACRQPVNDHLPDARLDPPGVVVIGRQGMPVGGKEEAGILRLQLDPVFQYTVIVAEVETPGGAHAGEDAFSEHE